MLIEKGYILGTKEQYETSIKGFDFVKDCVAGGCDGRVVVNVRISFFRSLFCKKIVESILAEFISNRRPVSVEVLLNVGWRKL